MFRNNRPRPRSRWLEGAIIVAVLASFTLPSQPAAADEAHGDQGHGGGSIVVLALPADQYGFESDLVPFGIEGPLSGEDLDRLRTVAENAAATNTGSEGSPGSAPAPPGGNTTRLFSLILEFCSSDVGPGDNPWKPEQFGNGNDGDSDDPEASTDELTDEEFDELIAELVRPVPPRNIAEPDPLGGGPRDLADGGDPFGDGPQQINGEREPVIEISFRETPNEILVVFEDGSMQVYERSKPYTGLDDVEVFHREVTNPGTQGGGGESQPPVDPATPGEAPPCPVGGNLRFWVFLGFSPTVVGDPCGEEVTNPGLDQETASNDGEPARSEAQPLIEVECNPGGDGSGGSDTPGDQCQDPNPCDDLPGYGNAGSSGSTPSVEEYREVQMMAAELLCPASVCNFPALTTSGGLAVELGQLGAALRHPTAL